MEMTKAGVMEEMIDDTLEDLDEEDEELTEEADLEIEKVLFELTDGKLGQLGSAGKDLPVTEDPEEETRHEAEIERMRQQLDSMLNG